jgi:hypothetical protein
MNSANQIAKLNNKRIINNQPQEHENEFITNNHTNSINPVAVNLMINNNTKNLDLDFQSNIIQCALEYNQHIICQLEINKSTLSSDERDYCLDLLYDNLKKLATNAKDFCSKFRLSKNNKLCKVYPEKPKTLLKQKRSRIVEKTGITITIDKSILNLNNETEES